MHNGWKYKDQTTKKTVHHPSHFHSQIEPGHKNQIAIITKIGYITIRNSKYKTIVSWMKKDKTEKEKKEW